MKQDFHPSVQVFSWNSMISFFFNFGMVLETHMKLCVTEPDLPENFLGPQNWKYEPKMG